MGMPATHMHHHVHVPWTTIIVLIVAIAVAAVVLYAINRDTTTTETSSVSVVAPVTGAVAVPQPENRVFFNDLNDRLAWLEAQPPAAVMADYGVMHFPVGTEGGRLSNGVSATTRDAGNPYWRIEFRTGP